MTSPDLVYMIFIIRSRWFVLSKLTVQPPKKMLIVRLKGFWILKLSWEWIPEESQSTRNKNELLDVVMVTNELLLFN